MNEHRRAASASSAVSAPAALPRCHKAASAANRTSAAHSGEGLDTVGPRNDGPVTNVTSCRVIDRTGEAARLGHVEGSLRHADALSVGSQRALLASSRRKNLRHHIGDDRTQDVPRGARAHARRWYRKNVGEGRFAPEPRLMIGFFVISSRSN